MRKLALLFICMFFAAMARAQTGTIVLSVTSSPTTIRTDRACNYVVIQENSATPSNAFTITLPGGSTGITYPAGTKFVFASGPNGFVSGQSLGTITINSGTVAFIGIESIVQPTLPASASSGGGGGGGGSPGLPFNSVQFNLAGSLTGNANLLWNNGTNTLTLGSTGTLDASGALAVKLPCTLTQVMFAGTGGAVTCDSQLTWDTANHKLFAGPPASSFVFPTTLTLGQYAFGQLFTSGHSFTLQVAQDINGTSITENIAINGAVIVNDAATTPEAGGGLFAAYGNTSLNKLTTLSALEGDAENLGSGHFNVLNGLAGGVLTYSATEPEGNAVTADLEVESPGVLTLGREVRVLGPAGTGIVTVMRGIEIEDQGTMRSGGGSVGSGTAIVIANQTGTAIQTGTGAVNFGDQVNSTSYFSAPVHRMTEGAAPSGVSSTDLLYGLSSIHWPAFNANNGGQRSVCGSTGTMTSGHIVAINTTGTLCDLVDGGTGTGSGSVTIFSSGPLATGSQNFFTTSVATAGTTPAQTFALVNSPAHKFFGNNTGSTAAPDYLSLVEADLPSTTVSTDIVNTFGAHLNDFSAATIKGPVAASGTTAANGNFIYDTTNKNWHFWTNGADLLMVPLASGFTTGHCGQPTSTGGAWVIADAGAGCGTGSGPTLQTNGVSNTTQTALNFVNTTGGGGINFTNPGTSTESASLANTVGGGNAALTCTVTGGTAGQYFAFAGGPPACQNVTPGIIPNHSKTCASYTILQADLGTPIFCADAGAAAVTLNSPASYTANFYFCMTADAAGTVTVTASGSVRGSGTLAIPGGSHDSACFYNNGSTWDAKTSAGF